MTTDRIASSRCRPGWRASRSALRPGRAAGRCGRDGGGRLAVRGQRRRGTGERRRTGAPARVPHDDRAASRQRPHPRGRDVVRRDRRGGGRRRPAHRRQRRRQPGRAPCGDRRHRPGGRRAGPPALDDPGAGGGAPSAPASRTGRRIDAVAVTEGPRARRLAAGRHHHGQDARLGPRPAAGAGQPPRGPHLRRVAARRRTSRTTPSPSSRWSRWWSAAATRSWSRWRTTCATASWGRPWTMRPARRSTRSAGCSGCPTRAARRSCRRRPAPRSGSVASRAPGSGDTFDFSFSGLKTAARRAGRVGAPRAADDGGRLGRDGRAAERPLVAELAYAFQESVVDVLATKTALAAERCRARSIVLGGGVAANSVLRERIAARAASLGVPLVVPRPGLCTDNAAMIGAAGFFRARAGTRAGLDLDARPSLKLAVRATA